MLQIHCDGQQNADVASRRVSTPSEKVDEIPTWGYYGHHLATHV
jgi:hypothetical protein